MLSLRLSIQHEGDIDPMRNQLSYGDAIKEAREAKGVTISNLAEKTGYSINTLKRLEASVGGKAETVVDTLSALGCELSTQRGRAVNKLGIARNLRINKGLTMKQLAEKVGCHYKTIEAIEKGRNVDARIMLKCFRVLGCELVIQEKA